MKKILMFLVLTSLCACQNYASKEVEKTTKSRAASDRINSSDSNASNLLKELD